MSEYSFFGIAVILLSLLLYKSDTVREVVDVKKDSTSESFQLEDLSDFMKTHPFWDEWEREVSSIKSK